MSWSHCNLQRTVRGFAPAKVNLTLHVTGRRPDGYHLLDSLVAFADVGDRLTSSLASDLWLDVEGPFAEGVPTDARNLVWQAAELVDHTKGARIRLEKHLPHAAGIGGGSSDAAAALRMLTRLWDEKMPRDPAILGADVPVCLLRKAARMRGIGEDVAPVTLPPLPAVLVNPGVAVPTAQVFAALDTPFRSQMPASLPEFLNAHAAADWIAAQRNDLEAPARSLAPEIDTALDALISAPACLMARMSGSGATCFGLFADRATAEGAAHWIRDRHPKWWVMPTVLT
ncbi:MAG: 4-(cytidine 5'-diphospho)-2-C-methyl-D-erythritol kinase [Shimia sp.]